MSDSPKSPNAKSGIKPSDLKKPSKEEVEKKLNAMDTNDESGEEEFMTAAPIASEEQMNETNQMVTKLPITQSYTEAERALLDEKKNKKKHKKRREKKDKENNSKDSKDSTEGGESH